MPNRRWNAVARQTRAAMPQSIARSITLCWARLGLGALWNAVARQTHLSQLQEVVVEDLLPFSGNIVTIQWMICSKIL